jgi:hypothetical protein
MTKSINSTVAPPQGNRPGYYRYKYCPKERPKPQGKIPCPEEKSLYSKTDVVQAATNVAVLGARAVATLYGVPPIVQLGLCVANVYQAVSVSLNTPRSPSTIQTLAHPMAGLVSEIAGEALNLPGIKNIHSIAKLWGVITNSGPKLGKCMSALKNSTSNRLQAATGAILHLFNLGFEGYNAVETYQGNKQTKYNTFESKKFREPNFENHDCPSRSSAEFAKMKPNERFTAEGLDPTNCPQHAAIILGVDENSTCNAIKSAFRKMSLLGHPDKPGGSAEALDNLTKAKNTLIGAQKC